MHACTSQTVPNISLENVKKNAGILDIPFIPYAESMGFGHEYDVELKKARTQEERYLLLGKLVDENLTGTRICQRTVSQLAEHCTQQDEFETLKRTVAFSEQFLEYVKNKEVKFVNLIR